MPTSKRRSSKLKKDATNSEKSQTNVVTLAVDNSSEGNNSNTSHDLILTSEKRRGIFECDYCHADISQLPRIRCAVCVDFDLCLDCFVSTQPHAVLGNHDASKHGYRVCESTRYPVFPTGKAVLEESTSPVSPTAEPSTSNNSSESTPKAPADQSEATKSEGKDESTEPPKAESDGDDAAKMEVDTPKGDEGKTDDTAKEATTSMSTVLSEDPKAYWTVEEDLRLLEGIKSHGLGNWVEISESVSGQGSVGKTPRRCMERYFDDFLGRYGHIVPPYTLLAEEGEEKGAESDEPSRASKRSSALLRSPGATVATRKRYKTVPSESLKGYENVWPDPYLPPIDVKVGQEVGRDTAYKAEQHYVKMISSMDKHEIERVHKEWSKSRLLKPNGPTVLPPRPDDVSTMQGGDLVGFMPRREDFDIEWENEAEQAVADMEFIPGESKEDRALKLQVLEIYNSKLDEREQRKKFILSRKLYDYRKIQAAHEKLPPDERDLVHRMRVFERFHTPEEHKVFIADLLKAKKLRKEIAKLQMYRRVGLRTLAEAEKFELDRNRRQFHKAAQVARGPETAAKSDDLSASESSKRDSNSGNGSSLWKTYRTGERRVRKSINRGSSGSLIDLPKTASSDEKTSAAAPAATETSPVKSEMEIDSGSGEPSSIKEGVAAVEKKAEAPAPTPNEMSSLTPGEQELCDKIGLTPAQYLQTKDAIIFESLQRGLLDKEGPGSNKRTLVQIDVSRRKDVLDYAVRAGWVSNKTAARMTTAAPALVAPDPEPIASATATNANCGHSNPPSKSEPFQ